MAKSAPASDEQSCVPLTRSTGLFLISFAGLFLELLLIRWIATEINIFAYLQNTVLVVCFLGFGIGCMTSRQSTSVRSSLLSLLMLVGFMAIPATRLALGHISHLLSRMGDLVVWDQDALDITLAPAVSVALGLAATFGLMLLICHMFVPIGRILGRLMDDHPQIIRAYSINIAGSLLGVWFFTLLSVYYQPPFVWFLIFAICFLPFLGAPKKATVVNASLLAGIVGLAYFAGRDEASIELLWSPYQKLAVQEIGGRGPSGNYNISVNNTYYLSMYNHDDREIKRWPELYPPEMSGLSQYDIPPLLHENPHKVLIVGSGGGNDIAGALRHGVKQITAVEIDPAIIQLGRKYHREKPYDSKLVRVVNDDARSFFATTDERFDVIVFGLLDSHTTTAMTNARLDHYVYTEQALRQAKHLLVNGGIISLAFEARKPFIADRIAGMLREIFGEEPLSFRVPYTAFGPGGRVFVVGNREMVRKQLTANPRLSSIIAKWQALEPAPFAYRTPKITDDWPYLYLPGPVIPTLYYGLALLVGGLFFYAKRKFASGLAQGHWHMGHWHFFFLGAGFLLLEVQNISKAAVVLGNTWWVNMVIISGVLIMILLANTLVARFPRLPLPGFYIGLIGSCLLLFFVDLSKFGFLPYYQKATLVAFLAGLPIFFSGVIFIRSFAVISGKDTALGANLVGAMIGGLLQSLTFIVGIKALLLIVAALYLAALSTKPKIAAAA
jgi:spermidine synthase